MGVTERKGVIRIVITPIMDDKAPYTMIPNNIPMPTNTQFIYDKYRDEGYFGSIPLADFINIRDFYLDINLTDGLDLDIGVEDIHVYYQHGRILYRPNKPFKTNIDFDILREKGLVYGINMGSFHRPKFYYYNKNGKSCLFNIELLSSMRFNIVSKETRSNVLNDKVFKTRDHLWFSNDQVFS